MFRSLRTVIAVAASLAASIAQAQGPAGPSLSIAAAEKMAAACVAYAAAHQGAVNIWIYDTAGGLVHFQRMDGAPATGPSIGRSVAPDGGFGTLSAAADADGPGPAGPGSVPVNQNGRPLGTVRVAGMGTFSDRACAQAAAQAGSGQRPQP
jgi:uncharacterized protein GlcG (DUF336 family)